METNKGRFLKGNIPFNIGKKLEDYLPKETIEKIKSSQFIAGVHTMENSKSWVNGIQKPKNDCRYLNTGANTRERYPRVIYEKEHGKVPKNWVIYHIDKNKYNDDVDNLIAIPRSILIKLCAGRLHSSYYEITKELEIFNKKCNGNKK